jgi:hypothetical protein
LATAWRHAPRRHWMERSVAADGRTRGLMGKGVPARVALARPYSSIRVVLSQIRARQAEGICVSSGMEFGVTVAPRTSCEPPTPLWVAPSSRCPDICVSETPL